MHKKHLAGEHIIRHDGLCSHLFLDNGCIVVMDTPDYISLLLRGIIGQWFCETGNTGQDKIIVKVRGQAGRRSVANLIINPPRSMRVSVIDGDPYNLRRSNLQFGNRRAL